MSLWFLPGSSEPLNIRGEVPFLDTCISPLLGKESSQGRGKGVKHGLLEHPSDH